MQLVIAKPGSKRHSADETLVHCALMRALQPRLFANRAAAVIWDEGAVVSAAGCGALPCITQSGRRSRHQHPAADTIAPAIQLGCLLDSCRMLAASPPIELGHCCSKPPYLPLYCACFRFAHTVPHGQQYRKVASEARCQLSIHLSAITKSKYAFDFATARASSFTA